jgi:serine phosphatase RsbU (regulator of sigma subunit)
VDVPTKVVSISVNDRERVVLSIKDVVGKGVEVKMVPVKVNKVKLRLKACESVITSIIVTLAKLVNMPLAVTCVLSMVDVTEVVMDVK